MSSILVMDMMRTGINSIVLHFWYHQVRCIEFKLLIGIGIWGAGARKIISPGYRVFDYTFAARRSANAACLS
jgi:hypothetical protein